MRDFAHGIGMDAKTDRIDARVISRFGEVVGPAPMAMPSDHSQQHSALVTRRSQLLGLIGQEASRLKQCWDEKSKRSIQKTLEFLKNEAIVACMRKLVTLLNFLIKSDQLWTNKMSVPTQG